MDAGARNQEDHPQVWNGAFGWVQAGAPVLAFGSPVWNHAPCNGLIGRWGMASAMDRQQQDSRRRFPDGRPVIAEVARVRRQSTGWNQQPPAHVSGNIQIQ